MHIHQLYILITRLNWIIRQHGYMPDVNIGIKPIHWYGCVFVLHEVTFPSMWNLY